MKALVTGSAGFLGRHFTSGLESRGFDVCRVDIADHVPSRRVDALDFFRTDRSRFDLAVHCAAVVGGRQVIDRDPLKQVLNHALDAAYIHWCALTRPRRAVYLSSSAAYPTGLQQVFGRRLREDDITPGFCAEPDAGYGWCKLTGERLVAQAWDADVNMTVVRPFSGYGTDQSLDYPFPSFIDRAARRDVPFQVWGTGLQVRDWVHVDDVIAATLTLADDHVPGPVNIGTGMGLSMLDVARKVCRQAGYSPRFATNPSAPTGVGYRVCDPTLLNRFYQPKVTLEEGIARALQHST